MRTEPTLFALVCWLLSPWLSLAQDAETRRVALAELLEEGIYLQEAKGDLEGAMAVYRKLQAQSEVDRQFAAEAQYRLATCYLEKGERLAAVESFEKLVNLYADQAKWVEAALEYLPKEFEPNYIPWSPGERTVLKWRMPTGAPIGQMVYTVEEGEREGVAFWKFSGHGYISQRLHLVTEVEKISLEPLHSHFYQTLSGMFYSQFKDGEIITLDTRDDTEKKVVTEGRVYDFLQFLFMLRQISPEIGGRIELPVYSPTEKISRLVPIEVIGNEILDTKIGQLEAYKIKSKYEGIEATYWISNDEKRRLLKVQMGGLEGSIVRFEKINYGQFKVYHGENSLYSIEYPESWDIMNSFVLQKTDIDRIFFLDPKTPDESYLYSRRIDTHNFEEELSLDEDIAMDQIADSILSIYGKRISSFELLGDGIESLTIDDRPARLFLAKGEDNGEKIKFMRGVISHNDMLFHFSCRKREADFDESIDVYRQIFNSIRFRQEDIAVKGES